MKSAIHALVFALCIPAVQGFAQTTSPLPGFRPPAVPLITHDPYFSIWSFTNELHADWTKHWTGKNNAICLILRVDGKAWNVMGRHAGEKMLQHSVRVFPTRTVYEFAGGGTKLTLSFITPALPTDIDLLSRPVSYLAWNIESTDAKPHKAELYWDVAAEIAANDNHEFINSLRTVSPQLDILRLGTVDQNVLNRAGDDLRINWGYLYLAASKEQKPQMRLSAHNDSREAFVKTGTVVATDDLRLPRAVSDNWPVLACSFAYELSPTAPAGGHVLLAYDDIYSIEFLNRRLRPYWRRAGMEAVQLLEEAEKNFDSARKSCEEFDTRLMADLESAGGAKYATLAALAYRQCLAGGKIAADFDGKPLLFSKENFSNGCIATVDVIYPASPFFLLFNPDLLKAQLTPLLEYAHSARWKFPFAPHDLGTYPLANGQRYGGGEKTEENQMPVEESGNMLIMMAALAKAESNGDYARPWMPLLKKWAEYLSEKGLDPENQLCTDDFAGHLAHNVNLSVKAILGIASYAYLCDLTGEKDEAAKYRAQAQQMAAEWEKKANDGNHYRLTFDKPGTWSQKYNLVWDEILGFNLFPKEIAAKEVAYYKTKMNKFGLPLDSRNAYTKLDWAVWSATLANNKADFEALVTPLYDFAHQTPDRVPLTDWFETTDAKRTGFQARSVVGGVFIPLLKSPAMWSKWARGGEEVERPPAAE